jgi:replicative DNA helicase
MSMLSGHDLVRVLSAELIRRHEMKSPITGIPTGLAHFDALTSGLQAGEMTVIAARPGGGKTAIALEMIQRMSLPKRGEAPTPVLMLSLEMSARALAERLAMALSGLPSSKLRRADFSRDELNEYKRAATRIVSGGLTVMDAALGMTSDKIGDTIGEWCAAQGRPGVVIVDYLQLIRPGTKRQPSREREVAEASMSCRAAARQHAVPIVALAQLSRAGADRSDPRPRATDLRESGQIEQDADVIALLHTAAKPEDEDFDRMDMIVEKNRNGAQGTVKLRFDRARQRIHEVIEDA